MLWTTPIYRFRLPKDDNPESQTLKEILREIFKQGNFKKIETVLEFGAGKLKNLPFILKQWKTVCAVEFKELSDNSFTKENLKECRKYGSKFQKMIFPNPFLSDHKMFDLALLLNVPPVMPIPAERLYLLNLLYNKINKGKYLLWVAQKEGSYKKIREDGKNNCGDGLWMGKGR